MNRPRNVNRGQASAGSGRGLRILLVSLGAGIAGVAF